MKIGHQILKIINIFGMIPKDYMPIFWFISGPLVILSMSLAFWHKKKGVRKKKKRGIPYPVMMLIFCGMYCFMLYNTLYT